MIFKCLFFIIDLTKWLYIGTNYLFRNAEEVNMKISERGQITVPKTLRDRFGLHKNVEIDIISTEDGILIQKRSRGRHPVDSVYGVLGQPSDTDTYIEEVRGR
jgi:AbrB family looped-hinge helix DNA binding protein